MPLHLTNQLRRAIESDPSRVVLIAGAGLSASAVRSNGGGLPDWDALVLRMIEDLRDAENCDAQQLGALEDMAKQGKHLQVALAFKERTRPDQFAAFLKHALDPIDLCSSEVHEVLLRTAFRGIITTNFDTVFEHQSNRLQPLVYPQFLDDVDSFRRPGFFAKIHGCIRNTGNPAENLILTEDGYATLRANPKYKMILHSLFVMHPVLTVGFSLRDPDFIGIVDDLKEALGDSTPTIYSLMYRPSNAARDAWRQRGVEIIPYSDHSELLPFFKQLLSLTESKRSAPQIPPPRDESRIDYDSFLDRWVGAQTIEDTFEIVARQVTALPSEVQREAFLFQLLASMDREDQICLTPHLVALGTKPASKALLALFKAVCKGDKWEAKSRLARLKPHALHDAVHRWALGNWQNVVAQSWRQEMEALFGWLLDPQWAQHGIDLWDTFLGLLNQVMAADRRNALCDLYDAAAHLQGAQDRIERIVFEPGFVREDDSERGDLQRRWYKSWDEEIVRHVEQARFEKTLNEGGKAANPVDLIRLSQSGGHWRSVVRRLLTQYVHRTHLTLHSFSGEFNPGKADEILEALASVKDTQRQLEVLWEINHWPEGMRGLLSLGEDFASLREGLFVPLWWRFSSEARIQYLEGGGKRRMMSLLPDVGQEFLLDRMMGLSYDLDKDFREAFLASSEEYKSDRRDDGYNPNFLMGLWRGRALTYQLNAEAPPELVRRIATNRAASEKIEPEIRWQEAQRLAESVLSERQTGQFVGCEGKNYVIDNLLGAYFPDRFQIVLYSKMIDLAARDLGVEPDALCTVVYIHQTVHAFSHLGKDRDGLSWIDFGSPSRSQTELNLSPAHESVAQYYTYKLVEHLRDERLMNAFTVLEQNSTDVYGAWRATKNYSLEQMRRALITLRRRGTDWPPKV